MARSNKCWGSQLDRTRGKKAAKFKGVKGFKAEEESFRESESEAAETLRFRGSVKGRIF
ncbi:hypothetical protein CCACVL1_19185 [Corchorus capsularis]|uniref:Uncharacterized protein n=1 Tax=Corchorus capsularis TaxID=210143 RepID=A0A1R3HI33_COCAP|nr:hypothetical protein CCACVL1_19185 [Corchorus capsularis]